MELDLIQKEGAMQESLKDDHQLLHPASNIYVVYMFFFCPIFPVLVT